MTEIDEKLFTAAKLYEQVAGDLDGDPRLLDHAGLPLDPDDRSVLSFLAGSDAGFTGTSLHDVVDEKFRTAAATEAIETGDDAALSYLVGVTEKELDASQLTLPVRILDELSRTQLTAVTIAGNPNSGKTNTMLLLAELARLHLDDCLVLTNVASWSQGDVLVQSMHDLMTELVQHRERPKVVVIDEGSTHFDARTNSREVSSQYTPAAKRFSKLGVEVVGVIGHTGKDIHPELKRITNLAIWKDAPDEAAFYRRWPEDASRPTDELFGGPLTDLEPSPPDEYDPDDMSPWSWNLDPGLFDSDFSSWEEFAQLVADARA